MPMKPNPPTHHVSSSAIAVTRIATTKTAPAANHSETRATTCTPRAAGRRGRSQFRNHTSNQCPPKEGNRANKVNKGHRDNLPAIKPATAPKRLAMVNVRITTEASGSRYGFQTGVMGSR